MNNQIQLTETLKQKLNKISSEILIQEDHLREVCSFMQENHKDLRWDGNRITYFGKPLIECKLEIRIREYRDLAGLVNACMEKASKLLEAV